MTDPIRLERLHVYLNRVLSDDEIISNPRIGPRGMAKIAKYMAVGEDEVAQMIIDLAEHLGSLTEAEDAETRYSFEEDNLGGLTLRDAKTGREKFLNVQQAAALMKMLDKDTSTEQDTLARVMKESVETRAELSADDMGSETSIFNFPWKLNESAGFAAAQYSGFGRNFRMKIVSVVDQEGNPIDQYDRSQLTKIARNYIDEA